MTKNDLLNFNRYGTLVPEFNSFGFNGDFF